MELCAHKEFPRTGIRILFPDALCPFAFICKDEVCPLYNTRVCITLVCMYICVCPCGYVSLYSTIVKMKMIRWVVNLEMIMAMSDCVFHRK